MRHALALFLIIAIAPVAFGADPVDFRKQIYPILHDRCFKCHQGADAKSGVRLDQRLEVLPRTRALRGASEPLIIQLVTSNEVGKQMPPKGARLTPEQVKLLKDWIEQGVKWDDELLPPDDKNRTHWAYKLVVRPAIPKVKKEKWVRNPIDAFIAATHERKGITSASEADRRILLRRLSLDLIGLPPTPEEITAFEKDRRPDAYERQVERLLASSAYGERWGRHWLDVARYADSEGYESDHVRPYAWRYRDWVVKAFNDDKPYNLLLLEQLAGDELVPYRDENLIATGFLASARLSSNEEDKFRQLNDMYVDITNATGSGLLGLTVGCAQCHDHKFDAITHKDYYRLQGFFLSGMPHNFALRDPAGWKKHNDAKPDEYDDARKLRDKLFERGRANLDEKAWKGLPPEQSAALKLPSDERTPEQHALAVEAHLKFQYTLAQMENAIPREDKPLYVELKKKVAAIESKLPDPPQTFGFHSPITSPHRIDALPMKGFYPPKFDTEELRHAKPFRLLAGDAKQRGEKLTVGWPAMFGPTPQVVAEKPTRTALAKWLTDPAHPLTARVWVNRVWHYHFGRGIVDTSNDFGLRGARPSHPELLDWLAAELVNPDRKGGGDSQPWSTKHIHRLIVTSATYRQSAQAQPTSEQLDPDNVFLSRWKPRRLEAEAVRDSMLVVSGELDHKLGGAPDINEDKSLRRGIYQLMKRQKPPMGLTLFDGPTAATESCPKRITTVTPLHALFILNNDFPTARAKAFANRVRKLAGKDHDKHVETAFLIALHRKPKERERHAVAQFFKHAPETTDKLAEMCHALMATVEFTTMQ
ncbi:MAG: PSD1 and planctomycete cytochrome C domain-containing protein [Planctomycetia bacterium]|nr:PSD1 and planctomycete cytochrome C domain-containing protein [Planctomycetia bacterium]